MERQKQNSTSNSTIGGGVTTNNRTQRRSSNPDEEGRNGLTVFLSVLGVGGTGNDSTNKQQKEVRLWKSLLGGFGLLSIVASFLIVRSRQHRSGRRRQYSRSGKYPTKGAKQVDSMVDAGKSLRRKREKWTTPKPTESEESNEVEDDLQEQHRHEQPWLRDQRIHQREKKRQTPSSNPFERRPHNPFERKPNNPFDSSSESSSSGPSASRRGGAPAIVSPLPRPLYHRHASPAVISPAKTASNPFDESSASADSQVSGITPNSTNPFSPSTASDDSNTGHGAKRNTVLPEIPESQPVQSTYRMISPVSLLSKPMKTEVVYKAGNSRQMKLSRGGDTISGLDSLEEVLDTSDETTSSTEHQQRQEQQQRLKSQRQQQQQTDLQPSRQPSLSESSSYETTPSNGAQMAAASLLQSFSYPWYVRTKPREKPSPHGPSTPEIDGSPSDKPSSYHDNGNDEVDCAAPSAADAEKFEFNLALHDLCDEARTTDDIAWRNALFLLSTEPHLASLKEPQCGMLPLHVCCLAHAPPPVWITRAFLHIYPESASLPDTGGRLPLHLVAATTADTKTMQLLVEEYPAAVSHTDDHGFSPLHLLLKNDQVNITLDHIRIVLGQTLPLLPERPLRKLQRRGEHLNMTIEEMQELQKSRDLHGSHQPDHQRFFDAYPQDVQQCLNRLSQWKRKQIRNGRRKQSVESTPQEYDNPASIATPTGKLLPLHLLVRRSAELSVQHKHTDNICDLVRALVGIYPEALVTQDTRGRTPLMTALLMKDALPSDEMAELLLGLRTVGYHSVASWTHDMKDLHSSGRWTNPAMIPTSDTHQLPLHVAAEEALWNYTLLASVYEAYPAARLVQDVRGRTPLHLALGNYQKISLDERIFELLYSSDIARTRDDDGCTPLDLVVRHKYILEQPPQGSTTKQSTIYQEFFHESTDRPQNYHESKEVLRMLQGLPTWLRRHACAATFVQDLVIERLAGPFSMAAALLNGCVLVALITAFRLAVFNFNEEMELNQSTNGGWYVTAIYVLAGYHLSGQVLFWFQALSQSEFSNLCLASFWRWVDLIAAVLAISVASMMAQGFGQDEVVEVAVVATGFLWLAAVGFMVQWSHGMALFAGTVAILLRLLVWPCLLAGALIVAFAQMFFTGHQTECSVGGGIVTICSLRDSFQLMYLLLLGQPAIDIDNGNALSTNVILLVTAFTILVVVLLLSVIVMALCEASNFDRNQIALEYYWEPKLATVLNFGALWSRNVQDHKRRTEDPPSCLVEFDIVLANVWDILEAAIHGDDGGKATHWYGGCHNTTLLQILAVFVLPLWIMLGSITLGIVWPPQVRRWLLRPNGQTRLRKRRLDREEDSARKVSGLRRELLNLKTMSYEQTNDVQQELRELKWLILQATQMKDQ